MDILLCEKPSQARAYATALGIQATGKHCYKGKGKVITWAFGHLLELVPPEKYDPKFKEWSFENLPIMPEQFQLTVSSDKRPQYNEIVKLLKESKRCIICTDFDREGEAIAREILDKARYKGQVLRAKCSSYEPSEMLAALSSLIDGDKTLPMYQAQRCRSYGDWLVGMNLSRLFNLRYRAQVKKKLSFTPSIGRVQTPMIGMCVLREKAIRNYRPATYYHVKLQFSALQGQFAATLHLPEEYQNIHGGLDSEADAKDIIAGFMGSTASVTAVSEKIKQEFAPLPYIPSKLFLDAEKLGISTKQAKEALQVIYEAGLVTYPRTDNPYLPTAMFPLVPEIFSHLRQHHSLSVFAQSVDETMQGKCWKDVASEDAAHHGIVPTAKSVDSVKLTDGQSKLYDLIAKRFIIQFAPPKRLQVKEIALSMGELSLSTRATILLSPGWSSLTETHEKEPDCSPLPAVEEGEIVSVIGGECVSKNTTKPKRFSEASLLEEMGNAAKYITSPDLKAIIKKSGLGTEATQTDIMNNEIRKGTLVVRSGKIHVPQDVEQYIDSLPEEIRSVDTTALWEEMMRYVETGEVTLSDFMENITQFINDTVNRYKI